MNKLYFSFSFFLTICITSTRAQELDVFLEEFNSNENEWPISASSKKSFSLKEGHYIFTSNQKNRRSIVYKDFLVDRHQDFLVEASLFNTQGNKKEFFGLVIGFFDWDNYSAFQINRKGAIEIYQVRNGQRRVLSQGGSVNVNDDANLLQLKKTAGKYTFYVNGENVFMADNLDFIGTYFGFLLNDKQQVSVDFFQIHAYNLFKEVDPIINGDLEHLGSAVNSVYTEKGPIISADGKTLYFTVNGDPNLNVHTRYSDAVYCKLDANNQWTPRALLPGDVNIANHNFLIGIAPDENHAYFGNVYHQDGSMSKGLSESYKVNGEWQMPAKVEIRGFRNEYPQVNYNVDNSGRVLIMAVENQYSHGGTDLYVSFKQSDNTWSEPQNMGNVLNTFSNEMTPFISADGKTLYFSSYGHKGYGSADVFVSRRLDDTWLNWSTPVNLGEPINGPDWDAYFKVDAKGEYGYMVSSGNDAFGNEDIFRVQLADEIKPTAIVLIKGRVFDSETGQELSCAVNYEDLHANVLLGNAWSEKGEGFAITLPEGRFYGFQAEMDGYFSQVESIGIQEGSNYTEYTVDLFLTPIKKDQEVTLSNMNVENDTISETIYFELDLLAEQLLANSSMVIDLNTLSALQGVTKDELQTFVVDYLIQKGVQMNQLVVNDIGEVAEEVVRIFLKLK